MQRIWAFLDWCFFGPAVHPGRPVRTAHPHVELSLRRDPRSVARGHQSARHGPGLHHPAVADSPARLQFRHPESLRRTPATSSRLSTSSSARSAPTRPPNSPRASCNSPTVSAAASWARWGLPCSPGRCSTRSKKLRTASTTCGGSSSPAASAAASSRFCHCSSWVRWCSWRSSGCRMRP